GPCGEGGVDGDVGVGLAESSDGFLVGLVAGLAAPPADAQLDGVARGSGNRSGSGVGSCSRRAAAAAGSQQAGCAYSTGDLQEVTTGNCVAHFFLLLIVKHKTLRGLSQTPFVYNYDNKKLREKKDANCGLK